MTQAGYRGGSAKRNVPGFIYFIQEGGARSKDRAVKIGWTDGDPTVRLRRLQTGNRRKLTLLPAVLEVTTSTVEDYLHSRYSVHRIGGEWFKPVSELAALAHGDFDERFKFDMRAAGVRAVWIGDKRKSLMPQPPQFAKARELRLVDAERTRHGA